jgi:hypothetical protein
MLLDRPLPPVYYRRLKRKVPDVEGYISWLRDPDRKYMPVPEILKANATHSSSVPPDYRRVCLPGK